MISPILSFYTGCAKEGMYIPFQIHDLFLFCPCSALLYYSLFIFLVHFTRFDMRYFFEQTTFLVVCLRHTIVPDILSYLDLPVKVGDGRASDIVGWAVIPFITISNYLWRL